VIYRVPVMLNREWRAQCAEFAAEDAAKAALGVGEVETVPGAFTPAITVDPPAEAQPVERFDLLMPRSACPKCKRQIRAIENIPVISWLFLRGKCAGCGNSISWRYPAIEILTAVMSAAVAWKLGFGLPAACGLLFTWYLIALAFIDIDTQLLPDYMTMPLAWFGIVAALLIPATNGEPLPVDLRSSVIGAAAGYMSLWLVYHGFKRLTGKEGMGYGDFKLLAAIGAWLGWTMLLPTILISAVVGAVSGVFILTLQKKKNTTPISFGPFLAAAGWLMLMFGHELVDKYLGLFGSHG
jgi:leader peptidase (prepilin peptidase) / N-methyltransferase